MTNLREQFIRVRKLYWVLIPPKGSYGYRKLSIYLSVVKDIGVICIAKPTTDSNIIIPGIDNSNYLVIVFASSILLSVQLMKESFLSVIISTNI